MANQLGEMIFLPKQAFMKVIEEKRHLLYGTSIESVMSKTLVALAAAATAKKEDEFITACCIAVLCSFTVSREVAEVYAKHGATTFLKDFDVSKRGMTKNPNSSWVMQCDMNATALTILGHAIASCAPASSSLRKKADEIGTIFKPVKGESEYAKITNERANMLTKAEIGIYERFAKIMILVASNVAAVFEVTSASFADAEKEALVAKTKLNPNIP